MAAGAGRWDIWPRPCAGYVRWPETLSPRMPAIMLDGRYVLHFAGWKKHIRLYPVPPLDPELEAEVAPFRAEKDSVVFSHRAPIPYEIVGRIAAAVVAERRDAER